MTLRSREMTLEETPRALALVGGGGRLELFDTAARRVVGHARVSTTSSEPNSPRLSMRDGREGLVAAGFDSGVVFARLLEGGRRIEPGPIVPGANLPAPTASVHHGRFVVVHGDGAVHVHGRTDGWEHCPIPPDFDTRDTTVDQAGVVYLAGSDRSRREPAAAVRRLDHDGAGAIIHPRWAWSARFGMSLRGCTDGLDSIDVSAEPWVGSASSEWFLEEPSTYVVIRRANGVWAAHRGRDFHVVRVLRARDGECVVVGSNGMLVHVRRDGTLDRIDARREVQQAVIRALGAQPTSAALSEPSVIGADIHESHLVACVWFRAREQVSSALIASSDLGRTWRALQVQVVDDRRFYDVAFAVER